MEPNFVRRELVASGCAELPHLAFHAQPPPKSKQVTVTFAGISDRHLREAGSYGYLVSATLPAAALQRAAREKKIVIRLEVDEALPGGLAIYGERFGRYPLDPTLVFVLKK